MNLPVVSAALLPPILRLGVASPARLRRMLRLAPCASRTRSSPPTKGRQVKLDFRRGKTYASHPARCSTALVRSTPPRLVYSCGGPMFDPSDRRSRGCCPSVRRAKCSAPHHTRQGPNSSDASFALPTRPATSLALLVVALARRKCSRACDRSALGLALRGFGEMFTMLSVLSWSTAHSSGAAKPRPSLASETLPRFLVAPLERCIGSGVTIKGSWSSLVLVGCSRLL